MSLNRLIKQIIFNRKWKQNNKFNSTVPQNIFPMNCVNVGKHTYGDLTVLSSNEEYKLNIGAYCSIGPRVVFVLADDHYMHHISTFPFKAKIFNNSGESVSKGDIHVGDDVWFGVNSIILSGVTIGQGAVVAAGAVVTKDVEAYAIVGGNPAKVIGWRFQDDIRDKLTKINLDIIGNKINYDNLEYFYTDITDTSVDEIINKLT